MLRLATANTPLTVDDREIKRDGVSFTIDTLQSLRSEMGKETSLVLCMGMDAFANLATWHRWEAIPSLAHIAVVQRAEYRGELNTQINQLLAQHQTKTPEDLHDQPHGKIYLTQLSQIPVSSTLVRQALAASGSKPLSELDPNVHTFIQQQGLYRQ